MKFPSDPLYGEFLEKEKCCTEIEDKRQLANEAEGGVWGSMGLDQGVKANP
jgi:hypothetical protein